MFARRKKSVLLIDFDNVERIGANLTRKIANWVGWIERGGFDAEGVRRELLIKRVYWNSQHDRHRVPFERAGFEVMVCQAWRSAKGSSVDFEITIDAIDYANSLKRLQEVGVKVNVVSDRKAFVDAVKPVYEKYRKEIGEDWIKKVSEAK